MNNRISDILVELKTKSAELSDHEKEALRDELLAYVLFDGINTGSANGSSGLNEQEKSLIRQLAEKTELLYKMMGRHNTDND